MNFIDNRSPSRRVLANSGTGSNVPYWGPLMRGTGWTRDVWLGIHGRVEDAQNPTGGTSQVARRLRVHQPMQKMQVRPVVPEGSTRCGAISQCASTAEAHVPQCLCPQKRRRYHEKPSHHSQGEAFTLCNYRKTLTRQQRPSATKNK